MNDARRLFEQELEFSHRISEPISIGWTHLRLARLASDGAERKMHTEAARATWLSIDRRDLIQGLDQALDGDDDK